MLRQYLPILIFMGLATVLGLALFTIGWILGPGRLQPRIPVCRNGRNEPIQPRREFGAGEDASDQVGFGQAGRQKIFARRLVGERAIAVMQVEPPDGGFEQLLELAAAGAAGGMDQVLDRPRLDHRHGHRGPGDRGYRTAR